MLAKLSALWRRRTTPVEPAEEIAQALLNEWLAKTDSSVLSKICAEQGCELAPLLPVFMGYHVACVHIVFGPRSLQSRSLLLADALTRLTQKVQSQLGDSHQVEAMGQIVQTAARRLAALLDQLDQKERKPFTWARRSLEDDFGIEVENVNPVTLFEWAHYWIESYIALSNVCTEICRTYGQGPFRPRANE